VSTPELQLAALELTERARIASRELVRMSSQARAKLVSSAAENIAGRSRQILEANELDRANAKDLSGPMRDRLTLNPPRLEGLVRSLREVAALPDPVGEVVEELTRPNGLRVQRVRAPLGVILMIYESRPNVTAEAAALCLRSGNAALLRGGKEALQTNAALLSCFEEEYAQLVPPDRTLLDSLLAAEGRIDLCIPRGGPGLIRAISEKARIPVIQHYQGVCHLYVAPDADLELAAKLVANGKMSRPGVCNALECLLVDEKIATRALPGIAAALPGVELRCDERALQSVPSGKRACAEDFGREFLDLILAVKVVDGLDGALSHIARYGSRHTESICTRDASIAERFLREVDASCAMWNASTRFNDGGELGLGAEIGISTSKLHAYGPMGLRELTCTRFVVRGDGQVRT
jgi:glutamate-5-semialdehyde dehydrogenase